MPFCTRCGREIKEGAVCECMKQHVGAKEAVDLSSFRNFIGSMKNRMGIGDESLNKSDWYERGKQIVPECVKPNEGEIPIKQYDVAIMRTWYKFMRAEGRLQLTNKRLIYRATGRSLMGRTSQQFEFAVDELAGVEMRRDYRVSFLSILLALIVIGLAQGLFGWSGAWCMSKFEPLGVIYSLLVAFGGLVPFFLLHKKFFLKMFCTSASVISMLQLKLYFDVKDLEFLGKIMIPFIAIALIIAIANFVLLMFMPNLVLEIKTKGAIPAMQIRRQLFSLFSKNAQTEYTGYAEVFPWKDTADAMKELWPMINDIQKLGDYGIQKWQTGAVGQEAGATANTQSNWN